MNLGTSPLHGLFGLQHCIEPHRQQVVNGGEKNGSGNGDQLICKLVVKFLRLFKTKYRKFQPDLHDIVTWICGRWIRSVSIRAGDRLLALTL